MAIRTEEQKIAQAPLEVILGGEVYKIRPLVIRDSREWRQKCTGLMTSLVANANVTTDNPDALGTAMGVLMVQMPDQVIDLFFEYAKDLEREDIEVVATEAEIAEAFLGVFALAFPLTASLGKAMGKLSQ